MFSLDLVRCNKIQVKCWLHTCTACVKPDIWAVNFLDLRAGTLSLWPLILRLEQSDLFLWEGSGLYSLTFSLYLEWALHSWCPTCLGCSALQLPQVLVPFWWGSRVQKGTWNKNGLLLTWLSKNGSWEAVLSCLDINVPQPKLCKMFTAVYDVVFVKVLISLLLFSRHVMWHQHQSAQQCPSARFQWCSVVSVIFVWCFRWSW